MWVSLHISTPDRNDIARDINDALRQLIADPDFADGCYMCGTSLHLPLERGGIATVTLNYEPKEARDERLLRQNHAKDRPHA